MSILIRLWSSYLLLSVDERRKSRHQQGVLPASVASCDLFHGLISLKEKIVSTPELSLEQLYLIAGNIDLPGAPVLNLALLYNPAAGALTGEAQVSQSVAPPYNLVTVRPVSGDVHGLGIGGATRVFSLSGEYVVSVPPPAIGSYLAKFTATFTTDNNWTGHGSFDYGTHKVTNVPIKKRG